MNRAARQGAQRRHYALAYAQNETRQARGFTWGREPSALVVELLGALGMRAGARALDLGCGDGRHCELLRARGFEVVGVDFTPQAVALCRRRFAARAGVTVVQRDLTDPGALEGLGAFDVAVDYSVMDHVRRAELPEYRRNVLGALAPGGVLVTVQFDRHIAAFGARDWVLRRGHYSRGFTPRGLAGAWPELTLRTARRRVLDDALAGLHFNAAVLERKVPS
ncbi:MAG: class I SAM-dependent methyltransferase [Myxococcaceae bacterium]|nr:class I SAM-dependent methyltransferase [Myxococcaceae bacterium]